MGRKNRGNSKFWSHKKFFPPGPIGETKYIGKTALHKPEVKSKEKKHLPGLYTFKTRLTADFGQIWIFEKQVPGLPET